MVSPKREHQGLEPMTDEGLSNNPAFIKAAAGAVPA